MGIVLNRETPERRQLQAVKLRENFSRCVCRRFVGAFASFFVAFELIRIDSQIFFVRVDVGAFEELSPSPVKEAQLFLAVKYVRMNLLAVYKL